MCVVARFETHLQGTPHEQWSLLDVPSSTRLSPLWKPAKGEVRLSSFGYAKRANVLAVILGSGNRRLSQPVVFWCLSLARPQAADKFTG
jgi:hypothetical protein